MRYRKLRIAWSVMCGLACVLLLYGFIKHDRSISEAPYMEEFADWNRYSFAILPLGAAAIAPSIPWPRRFSLRTLLVATTLVGVLLSVLLLVDTFQVAVWDGHFPLQVNLLGTKNVNIAQVASQTLNRMEYAKYVRTDPGKLELNPEHVDWIAGQPFTVQVPCSGRRSTFGRDLSYYQFRLLVLRITYQDGKVEFIPVEIPDGRETRQLTVSMSEGTPNK